MHGTTGFQPKNLRREWGIIWHPENNRSRPSISWLSYWSKIFRQKSPKRLFSVFITLRQDPHRTEKLEPREPPPTIDFVVNCHVNLFSVNWCQLNVWFNECRLKCVGLKWYGVEGSWDGVIPSQVYLMTIKTTQWYLFI